MQEILCIVGITFLFSILAIVCLILAFKINTNIQNKEIAVKLVEIRQKGINKCYNECLSENGVITLYKEYLEILNQ